MFEHQIIVETIGCVFTASAHGRPKSTRSAETIHEAVSEVVSHLLELDPPTQGQNISITVELK